MKYVPSAIPSNFPSGEPSLSPTNPTSTSTVAPTRGDCIRIVVVISAYHREDTSGRL